MDPTPIPQSPVQPIIPPQPAPPQPRRSFLPILLLIIIIAAASAFGGFYVAKQMVTTSIKPTPTQPLLPSPTPDETADWKTYSASFFSFKYPNDWMVSNSEGQSGIKTFHYLIDVKIPSYQYGPEPATMSISYWDNPQKLDIPTYQKQIRGAPIYNSNYQTYHQGELVGYYTNDGPCEPVLCEAYTIQGIDKILVIKLFQKSATQYHQTLNQILSTFKFTDTNPTSTTQLPKKYFLPSDMFFDQNKYPSELTTLADTDLIGFTCSNKFSRQVDGKFSAYIESSQQQEPLTDQDALSLLATIGQKTKVDAVTICSLDTGRKLFSYEILANGGGAGSNVYYGLLSGVSLSTTAVVPIENGPYFTCFDILAITKTGNIYVNCGAGDGGFGSKSLYKLNINTGGNAILLLKCTSITEDYETIKPTTTCKSTQ
jgi:hypothetical protein